MTQLAQESVITIGKGDILGLILMAPGVFVGVMMLGTWAMDIMINGVHGDGWKVIPVALALCALIAWGMWEFAHWLTA